MSMRLLVYALVLIGAMGASAAAPSWTGTWDTRWRDGGARMELVQRGDTVSGAYPAYGGRIEGKVTGRELRGHWTEGPRTGALTFVLSTDGENFMGRFDTGEWWTGGRVQPRDRSVVLDQAGARQALRTFLQAGNAARSGSVDDWAKAAAVMDFGPASATLAPGEKLAAARTLFELVDQTTFPLWPIPGRRAKDGRLDLQLKQAGTNVVLPLSLVHGGDGLWRVLNPPDDLGKLREALLARSGGRLPPPDDIKRRATARDAFRSFVAGFSDWDGGGRAQVLDSLDLSGVSDATKAFEGELTAAYMNETIDRIGQILPQEIPDDPQNRIPYVIFSHPAGTMVLAPTNPAGAADGAGWRFTADTVRSARDLYTAIEDMPEIAGGVLPDVPLTFMHIRGWVRGVSPALLARIGPLEIWQCLGLAALLLASVAISWVLSFALLASLRLIVGGRRGVSERQFRWPLRLTLALLMYHFAAPVLGLPEGVRRVLTGATDVLLAMAIMWGGIKLIDTFGAGALRRADATSSSMDEILISLVLAALKLVLLACGLLFIAQALGIPYSGVLAGLGIGGLAVAFASKETLSNVFGAGILVADRPFRRGDYIEAGEAKGTVEHVGIRSTRVRTGEDSLIVVPNGKLADATVNNLGTRRHRVVKVKLLVGHGTPVETLDTFMEQLRSRIAAVPNVKPDSVQVGVGGLGPEGIEVNLSCSLAVRSGGDEQAAKTALMLETLRLAAQMRVALGAEAGPEASLAAVA